GKGKKKPRSRSRYNDRQTRFPLRGDRRGAPRLHNDAAPQAHSAIATPAGRTRPPPHAPGTTSRRSTPLTPPPVGRRACAAELAALRAADSAPKPPGWMLSPRAVRTFVLGDGGREVRRKFVGNPSLVDRAMVALATNRGLMLVGEPGTAKSLLSELLAAAI